MARRTAALKHARNLQDIAALDGVSGLNAILNAYSEGGRATGVKLGTVELLKPSFVDVDGTATMQGGAKQLVGLANDLVAELELCDGNNVAVIDQIFVVPTGTSGINEAYVDNPDVRIDQFFSVDSLIFTHP